MTLNEKFIKMIKRKLLKYHDQLMTSEAQVKSYIINPLLRQLNWDSENPEFVVPEDSISRGYTDYSLTITKSDGTKDKILIMEVKKLSKSLDPDFDQLGRYCFQEGSRYGLVTNGAMYILIKSFVEGIKIENRIIWKTNIQTDSTSFILRNLNTIDRYNIGNQPELIAKINNMYSAWDDLIKTPDNLVNALIPVFRNKLQEAHHFSYEDIELFSFLKEQLSALLNRENYDPSIPELEVEDHHPNEDRKPSTIRIGMEKYPISAFNQILINTVEFLIRKNKLTKRDLPIPTSSIRNEHSRYLVNFENKNYDGLAMQGGKKLFNGWWVMTNFNAADCEKYSRKLLEQFGFKPDILQIE